MKRIGIIGGGVMGLTLANELSKMGHDITIYEAAPQIGGLTKAWQLEEVIWDQFYHVILMSDNELRNLLTELNLEKSIQWKETRTGFYVDKKLYSLSNSMEYLTFPPLNLINKFRLAVNILYASKIKNWKKLESIYATDWLKKWSGKKTFEKMWQPLLRAKLGEAYTEASAAFIWTIIARLYGARKSGMKKEMFGYVPGGYATILDTLEHHLLKQGVNIKCSVPVQSITRLENGQIAVELPDNKKENFDSVYVTLPAPAAKKLCPQLSDSEKSKLENIKYLGIVCASVLMKKPLAGFYVTNITDEKIPFTGVIEMSSIVDKKYINGNSLIYLPKYVVSDDAYLKMNDAELEAEFKKYFFRMYPEYQFSDILAFKMARAKYVFALSTLNYSEKLPPQQTSVPNINIVNSAHIVNGTLNVNETIKLARQAVHTIEAD